MNLSIAPTSCTKMQFDKFDSPLSLDYTAKVLFFYLATKYNIVFPHVQIQVSSAMVWQK